MIRKYLSAVGAFLFLLLAFGGSSFAQSGGERITNFVSNAVIEQNGTATITETIDYDFADNQKHGIYRDIPVQYVVQDDQGYILNLELLAVERDGASEPYELQNYSNSYDRVVIGDSGRTISGAHTYTITYKLGPVAVVADDGTEIVRLDVPGTGWQVPILKSQSSIVMASAVPLSTTCYQGYTGGNEQTCIEQSPLSFASSGELSPGETTTIEAVYAAGTFAQTASLTTLQLDAVAPAWLPFAVFGGISGVFLLGAAWPALGYARYLTRRKEEIAYPRYEPPTDMGPAEIGLLIDNSSGGAELTATLINLAVKGHLKIVQTKDKKWYRNAEYELQRLDSGNEIREYEREIMDKIMGGAQAVNTKTLSRSQEFRKAFLAFNKTLKSNLSNLGFYKKVNIFSPTLASRMSDAGYSKWAEIEGFRRFLQMTEANRMAMLEAPKLKPEQFSEFLPYAIALGVEKEWAKQFENLEVDTSEWYQGSNSGLGAAYVASSLSSGLGAVAASANQSSGSSGAGGGFSGGGAGGGGGGSW
jgi:hypothetical protein